MIQYFSVDINNNDYNISYFTVFRVNRVAMGIVNNDYNISYFTVFRVNRVAMAFFGTKKRRLVKVIFSLYIIQGNFPLICMCNCRIHAILCRQ